MKTGAKGIALVKRTERLALKAYVCPAGVWTIGYGHTSRAGAPEVFPGMTITEEQADAILQADLEKFQRSVDRHVTVPLTQTENDALVSFVFNVGGGNFRASTLLRKLNAGQKGEVPGELLKWVKAHDGKTGKLVTMPGLVTRRHLEASLFTGAIFSEGQVPKRVTPPKPKPPRIGPHAVSAGAGAAAASTVAVHTVNCATIGADIHHALDLRLVIPLGIVMLAILGKFIWDTFLAPGTRLHQQE